MRIPAFAVVFLLLICLNISVAGEKYKEHTIHGRDYDKNAVERLLDESEVPAEIAVDKDGVGELKGKFKLDKSMKVEDAAVDFIDRHRNVFRLKDPKKELKLEKKKIYNAGKGGGILYYDQTYNGIHVWGHLVSVIYTNDGDIDEILGSNVPTPDIDTTPLVTEEEALTIAERDLGTPSGDKHWHQKAELIIYPSGFGCKLAYRLEVGSWVYFVNAKDGNIINRESSIRYEHTE